MVKNMGSIVLQTTTHEKKAEAVKMQQNLCRNGSRKNLTQYRKGNFRQQTPGTLTMPHISDDGLGDDAIMLI